MNNIAKNIFLMGIAAVFIFLFIAIAPAQEGEKGTKDKKVKIASEVKEIQGEISWIDDKHIAIVYNRDPEKGVENEIMLPIDESIRLEHKKSLSEMVPGDTVRIKYQQDIEEDREGNKSESRKAAVISFVKPAVKKPVTALPAESEETLSLKGLKGE